MIRIALAMALLLVIFACSTDPCDDTPCQHGGTCIDGTCDCPDTYEGAFCERQRTPISLRINQVQLINFPARQIDGSTWDVAPNIEPDLLIELYEPTDAGEKLIYRAGPYIDADGRSEYIYTPFDEVWFDQPTATYRLRLLDFEWENGRTTTPQLMGELTFQPHSKEGGFPSILQASDTTGQITARISVSYKF